MAIIYSYKTAIPTSQDVLLGTDRENENQTVGFTVADLVTLVNSEAGNGTVTSVDAQGDAYIKVSGGPIIDTGTFNIELSATGDPDDTKFLRGDNTWAAIDTIVPSGISVLNSGSLVANDVTSLNFTGDPVAVTAVDGDITIQITAAAADSQTQVSAGTGVDVTQDSNIFTVSNTGVTSIVAGENITIGPVNGVGDVTINASIPDQIEYAPGPGIELLPVSATDPLPEFAVDATGSNNYIAVHRSDDTALEDDYIAFNQIATDNVKTIQLKNLSVDALSSVKNYLTNTYVSDVSGFIKNTTDSFNSIDNIINVVTLTDAEYLALTPKDPNTLYLTVTTAATLYTATMNLQNNISDASGVGYVLSGDLQGATEQGSENAAYAFNTTANLNPGYQFSSPFAATNPSGTIPNGGTTVTQTLTGTVIPIPTDVTATLVVHDNITGGNGVGVTYSISDDNTGAVDTGPAPHSYSFNTGVTILDNDYEFVGGGASISPTQPNTGTISANTTINTTISGTLIKKTGTATLTVTNNITGGTEGIAYVINTSPSGLTTTGQVGTSYGWNVSAVPKAGFQFTSGPTYTPASSVSGTYSTTPATETITIGGVVAPLSACRNYTFTASAGAVISVTYCDGSTGNLTQGVDSLSNLCLQTGSYSATSGTINTVSDGGACAVAPRYEYTYVNYNSSSFAFAEAGQVDNDQTTTMWFSQNTPTPNTSADVWTTETGSAKPADGYYWNGYNHIIQITSGEISSWNNDPNKNLTSVSTTSLYTTSDDACENSFTTTRYVSKVGGSSLEDVNNMVFNSSNPSQGASIDFASNVTRFVRFSTSDDESQQVAGTTGSGNNLYNSGRITQANIVCPSTDFIYTMVPCPNQSVTSNFTASSPNQLTIGATYEVAGSGFTNIIATVQQETVGTAQATIAAAANCPGPTITGIQLINPLNTGASYWQDQTRSPGNYRNYNTPTESVVWLDVNDPRLILQGNQYVFRNDAVLNTFNPPGYISQDFYPCNPSKISVFSSVPDCNTYPAIDPFSTNASYIVSLNSKEIAKPLYNTLFRKLNANYKYSVGTGYGGLQLFRIIFDARNIIGNDFGNSYVQATNPQLWSLTTDSAASFSSYPCMRSTSASQMFIIETSNGSTGPFSSQASNQVHVNTVDDNYNIGCRVAVNVQLTLLGGKQWVTAPTFTLVDPSGIPVDPLNNDPLVELRSTNVSDAVVVESIGTPSVFMNQDYDGGGQVYDYIIRVDGEIQ